MFSLIVDYKKLLFLTIAFVVFTPIGTITHEYGHILAAKYLGYETTLHYGSMNYKNSQLSLRLKEIYELNKEAINNNQYFRDIEEYNDLIVNRKQDILWVRLGGPLQTIITGVIGLLVLYYRQTRLKGSFSFIDWLAVFLSLFWLREVFNLFMSITIELIKPNGSFFGGDEKKISELLELWPGTLSISLGLIGILISIYIIFKVIPYKLRFTFILSGLLGGVIGFVLWVKIFGPTLLP